MEEDVGNRKGTGVREHREETGKRVEEESERQSMDSRQTRQGSEYKKKGGSKGDSEMGKNRREIRDQAEDR